MHGARTSLSNPNAVRSGCGSDLLSPECPACVLDGAARERDIDILVHVLHRGERLFDDGAPFDNVYMIRLGTLKTSTVSACGEEQVTGFYTPGHLVGLDAIHSRRHVSSAVALETASVCSLPYEALCRLSARMPQVQRRLLARMSQRIRDDGRRLDTLAMRGAGPRVASFLIGLLDDCRHRGREKGELVLPMPRADIASYLVLAVETVSRTLSHLHGEQVVDVRRNRIRILDEPALRELAGEMGRRIVP